MIKKWMILFSTLFIALSSPSVYAQAESATAAQVQADGTFSHPYTVKDCQSTQAVCPAGIYLFKAGDDAKEIQQTVDAINLTLSGNSNAPSTYNVDAEWSKNRFALLFEPGTYDVRITVNYYTQVLGLGRTPDEVTLTGLFVNNLCREGVPKSCLELGALNNFWRGVENVTFKPKSCRIAPSDDPESEFHNPKCITWNVSQAAPMRNVKVEGDLMLAAAGCFNAQGQCNGPAGSGAEKKCPGEYNKDYVCGAGYASGGYMANVQVTGAVHSISQQQWFTRNSTFNQWYGGVWNMFFLNSTGTLPQASLNPNANMQDPTGAWPVYPITSMKTSQSIQEKPYLMKQEDKLKVFIPGQGKAYSLDELAVLGGANIDVGTINKELNAKPGLIIEPGIYTLNESIIVPDGKFVLGIGLPSLTCSGGKACLEVAGSKAIIAGIMLDAGYIRSESLLHVKSNSEAKDEKSASTLIDIFCRIGESSLSRKSSGPSTNSCLVIDADYTVGDNLWLWRADHDRASTKSNDKDKNLVQWGENPSNHGLVVNGSHVSMFGLFSEHHQAANVLWNGEAGKTYFYQSELPYNAPENWECADFKNMDKAPLKGGCPAYLVNSKVKAHEANGLGIYTFFKEKVVLPAAILSPKGDGIRFYHVVGRYLDGSPDSGMACLIRDYTTATRYGYPVSFDADGGLDAKSVLSVLGLWPIK